MKNIALQHILRPKVQMEIEVPLYSRSIATEDGGIYLIGGCNKKRNQYLKKMLKNFHHKLLLTNTKKKKQLQ